MAPQLPGTRTLEFLLRAPQELLNLSLKQVGEGITLFQKQTNEFIRSLEVPPAPTFAPPALPAIVPPTTPMPEARPATIPASAATPRARPATIPASAATPTSTHKGRARSKGYGMR